MSRFYSRFLLNIGVILLYSCNSTSEEKTYLYTEADTAFTTTQIEYATQFDIIYEKGYKIIELLQPYPGSDRGFRYLLLPKGVEIPASIKADVVIRIPVERMVSLSTTHIPALDLLNSTHVLVGFPGTNLISSAHMRERINKKEIEDLGSTGGLNIERLMELSPDLVMAYAMGPQDKALRSLEKTAIPVVLNADFMEQSALGRAEWIKFTAAFLNKEKLADSVFNAIKNRYDSLAALTRTVREKPDVFSGVVYNGTWFMPGGGSWVSRFFADAGANYLWSDNTQTGSLQLSFESVLDKAQDAQYWINASNYPSLPALAGADSRYRLFRAWKEGNVFTYIAREGENGGNEYLELGYSRPDIVLGDLIKIIHPYLMPDYEPYFYKRLQ